MKAYVVSFIDVTDPAKYQEYAALAPATIAAHGGRYVARNGAKHPLEGEVPNKRVVILEFPSVEKAQQWHDSEEYQRATAIRKDASTGTIFIIEGYEPPIPDAG